MALKILYLTQILSPSVGGGELVFFNLAKQMSRLGHEVHIICHKKRKINGDAEIETPSSCIQELELMGIKIHYVGPEEENNGKTPFGTSKFGYIKMHMGFIINALQVANKINGQGKIDIIHANTFIPVIPASMIGKILQIPVIITVHNILIDSCKQSSSQKAEPRPTSFIGPFLEKLILSLPVDAVHVVSKKVKEQLRLIKPKANAFLVYNGVEMEENLDLQFKLRYDKYVLYISRLVIGKNLQTVILAFKKVAQIMPDAKLIVVGDGPCRQEWQELADSNNLQNNISFFGHITSEKIKYELLANASAVVFPSISEGFAMVPIEAFQMSKPVLISNVRPSDELVDDNVNGYLLPPHDPNEWAEKILYLLNNPNICKDMGSKGRLKVLETFNMVTVSSNMEQLYEKFISKEAYEIIT